MDETPPVEKSKGKAELWSLCKKFSNLVLLYRVLYVRNSCSRLLMSLQFSSVQFSCSVVSDSLRPHGLQHARLPCPSPTPRACLNSCPSSQGCHPAISSSVVAFSSYPQSFPASGSFPKSQFFASGGPSIGVSASASVLSINIQDWFRIDWFDLLAVQGILSL